MTVSAITKSIYVSNKYTRARSVRYVQNWYSSVEDFEHVLLDCPSLLRIHCRIFQYTYSLPHVIISSMVLISCNCCQVPNLSLLSVILAILLIMIMVLFKTMGKFIFKYILMQEMLYYVLSYFVIF